MKKIIAFALLHLSMSLFAPNPPLTHNGALILRLRQRITTNQEQQNVMHAKNEQLQAKAALFKNEFDDINPELETAILHTFRHQSTLQKQGFALKQKLPLSALPTGLTSSVRSRTKSS